MSAAGTAFVTGGTGFVGSFLIAALLSRGWRVVALVRGPQAAARLRTVLGVGATLDALRVVEGDVCAERFGLGAAAAEIVAGVDEVWHCAASFEARPDGRTELREVNVEGTRRVLEFAAGGRQGRGAAMWHVSTAFAAPVYDGFAREEVAPADRPGRNAYECSKQEAERLVLRAVRDRGLRARIFRPSIIVGESRTGRAAGFAAYYDIVRALHRLTGRGGEPLRIQVRDGLRLNLVPVDFVVEAMWRLARAPAEPGTVFHVVNDVPVSTAELHAGLARTPGLAALVPVEAAAFRERPRTPPERALERMTRFEADYLGEEMRFDAARFRRAVPIAELPCPRIDAAFLERINRAFLAAVGKRGEAGR